MSCARILVAGSVAAAFLLALGVHADPAGRIVVSDLKPLLQRAIDAGYARGVMQGAAAAYVRQKFDTSTAIEIDVRVLHALPQPGCSRLEVRTRQKDVLENGRRADKELRYQVSYCRDGRFPTKE
ncbi:MAG: hypothetical protein IH606_01735 [Burkholderiales bacterium]|nr:hypothetical protein [Burkholderiales bacterium]